MKRVVVENVYIDGDPNGIVVSSMRMSPITAFVIPRNLLSVAKKIENINNPGVCFIDWIANEYRLHLLIDWKSCH